MSSPIASQIFKFRKGTSLEAPDFFTKPFRIYEERSHMSVLEDHVIVSRLLGNNLKELAEFLARLRGGNESVGGNNKTAHRF